MNPTRFDTITKLFAARRSRRKAVVTASSGIAAAGLAATGLNVATAQDGTPTAEASPTLSTLASTAEFLFLQSFESGTVAPKDGADGTYTLTLQHGLGQTIYFSDRPERIVGAAPTQQFFDGLGFSVDNPPNAALVVDTADGSVDIAVVELANPTYDQVNSTATYDISVLQNYQAEVDMQFQEASADLATVAASFGSAHLFIDDCPDARIVCRTDMDQGYATGEAGRGGLCWNWSSWTCEWCDQTAMNEQCNAAFPDDCQDSCWAEAYLG